MFQLSAHGQEVQVRHVVRRIRRNMLFYVFRCMNMFVSSEDSVAAIPLNSEKETLVPVRTKETVSAIDRWVTEEIGENEGFIIIGV